MYVSVEAKHVVTKELVLEECCKAEVACSNCGMVNKFYGESPKCINCNSIL